MTAKEYLQSYKRMKEQRQIYFEMLANVDAELITLQSQNFSQEVKGCPKNDPIGEIVVELISQKEELANKIADIRAKEIVIEHQLASMSEIDDEFYKILTYRYMLYNDWKTICDKMSVSRTQANRIHGKALAEFDKKFLKN